MTKELSSPLYLVTWTGGYPEQYLGRVYDNSHVALKVCESDQVVIELRLEQRNGILPIALSEKDYRRLMQLVMSEWGQTEQEVLEWIRDDKSPTWNKWPGSG